MSRFLTVAVRFLGTIALLSCSSVWALTCDVDNSGEINRNDIALITAALNTPVSGPGDPRDADGNGIINVLDARICALRCTRTNCALPPTNTAPVANADNYNTPEDTALVIDAPGVLGNDTDAEGNPITAALVSGPSSGTLILSANGAFMYTPPAEFTGTVTFTYRANDGALDSNVAAVTIDVTPVNEAPVANADSYSTNENVSLIVAAPGVLASDTDEEGGALTAALISGPASGALAFNADGSFSYTPAVGFTGTVSFTYRASDGSLWSNPATVTVTVLPVNNAPVAAADSYSTPANRALTVAAPGVLANDTHAQGTTLTALLIAPPAVGTLNLSASGGFTYTPPLNFVGQVTFTYRANDGALDSNVATVTIFVVNGPPTALDDRYDMLVNTTLTVAAPGVLANDRDFTGGACLIALLDTPPAVGTLNLGTDGSFTYSPPLNFLGQVTFTYHTNDCALNSNVATVTINVLPFGTGGGGALLLVGSPTIGRDEQQFDAVFLPRPEPSDIVVTLVSSDPTRLLLAPNAPFASTVVGSDRLEVTVPAGETSARFNIQALKDNGTVQVTASAPGFTNAVKTHTLVPSGFYIAQGDPCCAFLNRDFEVNVCFSQLDPVTLHGQNGFAFLRPGVVPSPSVVMTSSNTAVGTIIGSPSIFMQGDFCSYISTHHIYFRPLDRGTTTIAMIQPVGYSTPPEQDYTSTGGYSPEHQSITATITIILP